MAERILLSIIGISTIVILGGFVLIFACVGIRGAIIKKKTEKFGKNSLMGGRGKFFSKKSQFQFGNFEHPGGGLNFSKMSQSQLFCNYFAILPL